MVMHNKTGSTRKDARTITISRKKRPGISSPPVEVKSVHDIVKTSDMSASLLMITYKNSCNFNVAVEEMWYLLRSGLEGAKRKGNHSDGCLKLFLSLLLV